MSDFFSFDYIDFQNTYNEVFGENGSFTRLQEGVQTEVLKDLEEIQIPLEETTESSTEATSEATTIPQDSIVSEAYDYQYSDIEFLAPYDEETSEYSTSIQDNRPYLSSEVLGATINDVYTMELSIRNIVLLWFLVWLLLKCKTMIHNAVMLYMEGRK